MVRFVVSNQDKEVMGPGQSMRLVLKGPFTTNGKFVKVIQNPDDLPKVYKSVCKNVKYSHCPYFILQVCLINRYVSSKSTWFIC